MNNRRIHTAFTLIELLVVVAIIALLVSILLPSLSRARQQAQRTVCLSNQRQLVVAAEQYLHGYRGRYPIAVMPDLTVKTATEDKKISASWDYTYIQDNKTGTKKWVSGMLWEGRTNVAVHQCPSFKGKSNSMGNADPYTGYNYNTSYIGTYMPGSPAMYSALPATPEIAPARINDVRMPAKCAIFGDGEYGSGANKYMRSPDYRTSRDDWFTPGRYAGTQGFRHLKMTNVAFCDGHVESRRECHTWAFSSSDKSRVAVGTGFLSPDNSLYDLK